MLQVVEIRLDKQQIGAGFNWEEPRSWHNDTVGTFEVADCSSAGSFKLDNAQLGAAYGNGLLVWNDLHVESIGLNQPLDGPQVDPEVVGVEIRELLDGLELRNVLLGHLCDL